MLSVIKLFQNTRFVFFFIATLFLLAMGVMIGTENYVFFGLPIGLLIVWLALFHLQYIVYLIVFFVPLSIPLSEYFPDFPVDLFMPTEPLLIGLLLLFMLQLPQQKLINRNVLLHPVSIAIIVLMTWMLFTSITSTMVVVSLKFFLMRLWFVLGFYYFVVLIIKQRKDIDRFVWLYAIPMVFVIGYSLTRHLTYGIFDSKIAHWASNPFFKDHTIYGAALAFYIPILFVFTLRRNQTLLIKVAYVSILAIFIIALVFSYSRAAWLSVIGALGVFVLIRFRVNLKLIVGAALLIVVGLMLSWGQIMIRLEQNRQESSVENIGEHVKSVTNIRNDASNLERINRWQSAFRMFEEQPLLGFGPGTYMFQYAPYQMSYEKTIISTNAGDVGNAHSEYFGPLAEQGIFGPLVYVALIITVLVVGIRRHYKLINVWVRDVNLAAILGLVTYFIHGFLNNFLDTDKLSAPFWGFIAIIVAIDLKYRSIDVDEASNKVGV